MLLMSLLAGYPVAVQRVEHGRGGSVIVKKIRVIRGIRASKK